jgi:excisionase family DNA binding protein
MAGTMTDQGETFQRVSVAEAARLLGVSVATVRRRIRAGGLEAETVLRPQGSAFVVRLPVDASAGVSDAYDRDQEPGSTTRTEASHEQVMLSLVQAAVTPILAPVMTRLAEQEATIRSQAETIGELRAENRALLASTTAHNVEPTREPSVLFLRRRWLWVSVLAGFVVVIVLLLAWPR